MSLINHISARLNGLGMSTLVNGNILEISRPSFSNVKLKIEAEDEDEYKAFTKARSTHFDHSARVLEHNKCVEIQLTRLNTNGIPWSESFSFSDTEKNEILIGSCSKNYAFSFFNSPDYDIFFDKRVKNRLLNSGIIHRRLNHIFWLPTTATYKTKARKKPNNLKDIAIRSINSTLFKIAVEQNECFNIWKTKAIRAKFKDSITSDSQIPRSNYDENVVSFYKVAKSSPFPSQSFLAYYHVIEYYFLTVSESKLHDRLSTMINNPSFNSNKSNLDKLISTVRGQDARNDETQMLRNVLDRYIQEAELIDFISRLEEDINEKIYSKKRKIFGEDLNISLVKDHALSNSANVIKHIRNAIVHSSDKYKREDCHTPLSKSEDIVEDFIPLIRFLAEKVIYGNAT